MLDRLKSLPLTILLTVLIWMYAEAQFTYVQDGITINVTVASPLPDLTLRPVDGTSPISMPIVVSLQGPKNQIDRIIREATAPDADFPGIKYIPTPIEITRAAENGSLSLNWPEILNRMDYFNGRGVRVTISTPLASRFEVDRVRRFTRPVEYRAPAIVDHYSISPETVEVSAPANVLATLGGEEKIAILVDPVRPLENLQADSTQTVPARFVVQHAGPRDDRIRVTPAQGTLSVHITRQQQAAFTLADVPVWVSGPPALLARYDVDVQPKSIRLTVSGTNAAIESLRKRVENAGMSSAGVFAYVDLDADDRPADLPYRRRVRAVLPEGLTLLSSPPDVAFHIVEHVTTPPATTPSASVR